LIQRVVFQRRGLQDAELGEHLFPWQAVLFPWQAVLSLAASRILASA
jgi:hypothetical protein